MNCLAIAALGLKLLSSGDPGAYVRTDCGIQAGVIERDGQAALEAGLSVKLGRFPLRIEAGATAYRAGGFQRSHNRPNGGQVAQIVGKQPIDADGQPIARHWRVQPRIEAAAELPLSRSIAILAGFQAVPDRRATARLEWRF